MLGHAGLLAQGLTVAMVQAITPEYVYLNCGPLFHDGPMAPGRAMPMASVRIVDEDGADVPDGEVGEIVCRGPLAMVGYWRDPEETARREREGCRQAAGGRHGDGGGTHRARTRTDRVVQEAAVRRRRRGVPAAGQRRRRP